MFILVSISFSKESLLSDKSLPKIENGYIRYVLKLPPLKDEDRYKVELLIGKKMFIDGCNKYKLEGSVLNKDNYLLVESIGKMVSLSDFDCKDKKRDRFVSIKLSDSLFQPYSSKKDIILHIPKWYEVRYLVWQKSGDIQKAKNR